MNKYFHRIRTSFSSAARCSGAACASADGGDFSGAADASKPQDGQRPLELAAFGHVRQRTQATARQLLLEGGTHRASVTVAARAGNSVRQLLDDSERLVQLRVLVMQLLPQAVVRGPPRVSHLPHAVRCVTGGRAARRACLTSVQNEGRWSGRRRDNSASLLRSSSRICEMVACSSTCSARALACSSRE